MHCRYIPCLTSVTPLTDYQSLNHAAVAVIKLCYPICWELLKIIRAQGTSLDFHALGYHSSIFSVDLPLWLPCRIVEQMVESFKCRLCNAIELLMEQEKSKSAHKHNQSLQSDDGFTTNSSDSSRSSRHARPIMDSWPTA